MTNIYAIIDNENRAKNFILYDGVSDFDPGEGMRLVKLPENPRYGFEWIWDGEKFLDPNPVQEE